MTTDSSEIEQVFAKAKTTSTGFTVLANLRPNRTQAQRGSSAGVALVPAVQR